MILTFSGCGAGSLRPDCGHSDALLPPESVRLVSGQRQHHQAGGYPAPDVGGKQRQPSAKQFRQETNH